MSGFQAQHLHVSHIIRLNVATRDSYTWKARPFCWQCTVLDGCWLLNVPVVSQGTGVVFEMWQAHNLGILRNFVRPRGALDG